MSKKSDQIDFFVTTYGFDALDETFRNFQYRDKNRIIMAAFKKATLPLVQQAQINIMRFSKSHKLFDSIGTLPIKNEIGILVGARKGGGFKGFHGHLLNDGTKNRYVKHIRKEGPLLKKPRFTGKMSAAAPYNRWFTKAAFSTERQSLDTINDEWYSAIAKFIIKGNNDRQDN